MVALIYIGELNVFSNIEAGTRGRIVAPEQYQFAGTVGKSHQPFPVDNGDELAPRANEPLSLEGLHRDRNARSLHTKHDGKKSMCER